MSVVYVPDVEGPTAPLCWKQKPDAFVRCDRRLGHSGRHTWEYEPPKHTEHTQESLDGSL